MLMRTNGEGAAVCGGVGQGRVGLDPLGNESYSLDLFALEELEGGSTGQRARERKKASLRGCRKMERRERERERERLWRWIRDAGRRHRHLFILRERGCAWVGRLFLLKFLIF
jgi:hypothetical protein